MLLEVDDLCSMCSFPTGRQISPLDKGPYRVSKSNMANDKAPSRLSTQQASREQESPCYWPCEPVIMHT